MKMLLTNTLLVFSAWTVMAQTESAGVPWTPVNLTGGPVSVSVVDNFGNVTGLFVVAVGQRGTLWVPVPAGGGVELGGDVLTLDSSGTNANYTVFSGGTNGVVMSLMTNTPLFHLTDGSWSIGIGSGPGSACSPHSSASPGRCVSPNK
jgi:hypothetical protein